MARLPSPFIPPRAGETEIKYELRQIATLEKELLNIQRRNLILGFACLIVGVTIATAIILLTP